MLPIYVGKKIQVLKCIYLPARPHRHLSLTKLYNQTLLSWLASWDPGNESRELEGESFTDAVTRITYPFATEIMKNLAEPFSVSSNHYAGIDMTLKHISAINSTLVFTQ